MRIIHLNSSDCDITDPGQDEVLDYERVYDALIRYLTVIGPDRIEEGDTFKIVAD